MRRPKKLFFALIFVLILLLSLCFWLHWKQGKCTKNCIPVNRPTHTVTILKKNLSQIQGEIDEILIKEPIKFQNDGYILDGNGSLSKVITLLKTTDENIVVNVLSHADINGSSSYNRKLTQRRADSVAQYLRERGVQFVNGIGYGREFLDKNSTLKSYIKISIIRIRDDF
jgi:hypothetical protein